MKLITWNVNGLRSCVGKGFIEYFAKMDADLFSVQEIKLQAGQIDLNLDGYEQYWSYAQKKGYSGTAIFSKVEPISVSEGIGIEKFDTEGRTLTLEFASFYLVNVYTPNSQRDLARLDFRIEWEHEFRAYILSLEANKPVIICGDLNVAHHEIDLKNAKSNYGNSGFTDEERGEMTTLLDSGFVDAYRQLYPHRTDVYTWWSFMAKVRERNIGWRIDYFLVSKQLSEQICDVEIHDHVFGSDHCPVMLEIALS